jgi:membrane protease YdiL (CAAX protease family)
MKERILRLSGAFELTFVLLLAFGLTVPGNLLALLSPDYHELVILSILIPFLKARGWTRERLGIRPTFQDSLWGVGILLAQNLIFYGLWSLLYIAWPKVAIAMSHTRINTGHFDWAVVIAVSIVNPVFEEMFVCAYLITALKERFGTTTAVNVSAAIRVFYHLYQGALAVLGITPMALMFGYWFARTGRLWPLIVAHALQDFIAMGYHNVH